MGEDIGATAGRWFETVRRARMGRELKLVALTVGSYANADGRGIFPGTARLAVDMDYSYRTAQRHLAELCRIGLLERVRRVRVRGKSDVYRLVLAADLLDLLDLPSPTEYHDQIKVVAEKNRRGRPVDNSTMADHPPKSVPDTPLSGTDPRTGHETTSVPDTDPPVTSDDAHPPTNGDGPTRSDGPPKGFSTQPDTRTRETKTSIAAEGEEQRPAGDECDGCGAVLDPDGTCFVCRTARSAS